jgi:hypothetical protein
MKVPSSPSIFNGSPLPLDDHRLTQHTKLKIAQRFGVCPATAGVIAHLAGVGPRGWR